jgi:Fe-S cluster assembly ATP-binding protein
MKVQAQELDISPDMLRRDLNVNYSGGEKKKQEILQMSLLNPKMSILDETDSGLDIDALRIVSEGVNKLRNKDNSFLVITHYQRLLNYIKPDYVHIIADGRIVKSGDFSLALELEEKGYEEISKTA